MALTLPGARLARQRAGGLHDGHDSGRRAFRRSWGFWRGLRGVYHGRQPFAQRIALALGGQARGLTPGH